MEMHGDREHGEGRGRGKKDDKDKTKKRTFQRRKICRFCADNKLRIDYKEPQVLRYFLTERGKVVPRRITGNCSMHQRRVAVAIKRARTIALLPFTVTGR